MGALARKLLKSVEESRDGEMFVFNLFMRGVRSTVDGTEVSLSESEQLNIDAAIDELESGGYITDVYRRERYRLVAKGSAIPDRTGLI